MAAGSMPTGAGNLPAGFNIYAKIKDQMRLARFGEYRVFEAQDAEDPEKMDELSLDRFPDLAKELEEMIAGSMPNLKGEEANSTMVDEFIRAFNRSPEDTAIEGLINDSDVYDFYLMWRSDIDDILSAVNFFDEVPSENKVYSLYDYIIRGTRQAVRELISLME